MTGPERRQTPRTTLDKHAYINIEPNNGGIVLNVSEGGLCVHSFDPVPRNGKVRFWFSDNGQRIEADATLAWTDETQKGGMRFATLPAQAQEKIRDWMAHPTVVPAANKGSAAVGAGPSVLPVSGGVSNTKAAIAEPVAPPEGLPELRVRIPLSGFSRGLVTGLLVSAVVVAGVLFHSYRRELGEGLIRLGERFAAKPEAQTLTVSAASMSATEVESPQPRVSAAAPPRITAPAQPAVMRDIESPAPAAIRVPAPRNVSAQPERVTPEAVTSPVKAQQAKTVPATEITAAPTPTGDPPKALVTPASLVAATAVPSMITTSSPVPAPVSAASAAPTTAALTTPTAGASNSTANKAGAVSKLQFANQPTIQTEGSGAENSDSSRELYFEVGKFKNVFQARDETDKLAQLGFPVTAVEKGHLWTNSFHVLVGPYPDEEQAKATHQSLLSDGFKPRPFEKGWRNFTLLSSLTLNGERTPEGDYIISWESYIGDANVKFLSNNRVVATAGGRWVKREIKYPRDAYVYRRNPDGSRTLLEIHFGGMRQALVFGKAS